MKATVAGEGGNNLIRRRATFQVAGAGNDGRSGLNEKMKNGLRQPDKHKRRLRLAESRKAGRGVNEHQRDINSQSDLQAALRQPYVRKAIENINGEEADEQFDREKRKVAAIQEPRHQMIRFGRKPGAHPHDGQLRVKPIEQKQ